MDSLKKKRLIRIARENPNLRQAVYRIMKKEAASAAWWMDIQIKKSTTIHTPKGNFKTPGKHISIKGKRRYPNLRALFKDLKKIAGHLKDLRLYRFPGQADPNLSRGSSKKPNSAEIWGKKTIVLPGRTVKRDYQIFITKGGRITPDEIDEMENLFNLWNVRGLIDVSRAARRQMVYERPVGEYSDFNKDPGKYQDYSTTKTLQGPNTPKPKMDDNIDSMTEDFLSRGKKVTRLPPSNRGRY
ncbi:MAG: hypothetical protein GF334_09690 [Candidatus Altiarchaeales archaeon]|nr:hypothetical protein [Candidatus Altiarchaeales archaeon]